MKKKSFGSRVTAKEWNALLPKHVGAVIGRDSKTHKISVDQPEHPNSIIITVTSTLPAFSIFAIGEDVDGTLITKAPAELTKDVEPFLLFTNGPNEITGTGPAFAINDVEPVLLRSSDVLTVGQTCGPKPDSYQLTAEGVGMTCLSSSVATFGAYWVIKNTAPVALLGRGSVTGLTGSTLGSGTSTIYKRVDDVGTIAATTKTEAVYNSYEKALASDDIYIIDETANVGLTVDGTQWCSVSSCCITPIDMTAVVSFGGFGDATFNVDMEVGNECTRQGSGQSDTNIPLRPEYGVNALMNGQYHYQKYDGLLQITEVEKDDDPYLDIYWLVMCWVFDPTTGVGDPEGFLAQEIPISGTLDLVVGDEPMGPPFFATVKYYLFTDPQSGHCILRVGCECAVNGLALLNALPDDTDFGASSLGDWNYVTGVTVGFPAEPWPNTNSTYKYSDWHPCAMDFGLLPPLDPEFYKYNGGFFVLVFPGAWLSGTRVELEDQLVSGSLAANQYTGPNGTALPIDVEPPATPAGWPFNGWAFMWEIDLTDEGITDLSTMPVLSLDINNLSGVYAYGGSIIHGPFTPAAGLPTDWEKDPRYFYTSGSTALWSGSGIERVGAGDPGSDPYLIKNDGIGGHVCDPPDVPVNCGTNQDGNPVVGDGGGLQYDELNWKWRAQVIQSTFSREIGSLSLTIGPATP